MSWTDLLSHPVAALAYIAGTIGQLGFGLFDPAWALISSTATIWFPALATTGATLLPEFGYETLGTKILIGAALVFVGVQLDKLIDAIQSWYDNR